MSMVRVQSILVFIFLYSSHLASSQEGVGIGTDQVNEDAILEIESHNDKGILFPMMNAETRMDKTSASDGLTIYDPDEHAFFYFDSGNSNWKRLVQENSYGTVPLGGIIMWSGSSADIPEGYLLCDGSISINGITTPNLVNSFVRGAINGSPTFAGALNVIPTSEAIDSSLIYNINYSNFGDPECSIYENIYSIDITYDDGCAEIYGDFFSGVRTIRRVAESCEVVQSTILVPVDCSIASVSDCIVETNPKYYLSTPEACLNTDVFLYWDLAYIMRVK